MIKHNLNIQVQTITNMPKTNKSIVKNEYPNFTTITLLNEKVYIPNSIDKEMVCFLKNNYEEELYNYLSSRVFYKKDKIFEFISSCHLYSIPLAKIFKNLTVFIVFEKNEEKELIEWLIQKNDIKNVEIIPFMEDNNIDENSIIFSKKIIENNKIEYLNKKCDIINFEEKEIKSDVFLKEFRTNRSVFFKDKKLSINMHINGSNQKITHAGLDIIVSLYNTKDYIIECIDSLLIPSRNDIRIIVVNDGSTDGSENIVHEKYKNNKQVILLNKLNGGCASARNFGRNFSTSTHISFIDADDFVDNKYYETLYDLAQHTGIEIVQGNFVFYDNENKNITTYDYNFQNDEKSNNYINFFDKKIFSLKSGEEMVSQPTIWRKVYRRDFLDSKNLYFPEAIRAFDDYYFHLMSAYCVQKILIIPEIKYYYRQHPNQDIKQGDSRHFNELHMFSMILKEVIDSGRWNFKFFVTSFINSINWSSSKLKEELLPKYIENAAEILVFIKKIYKNNGLSEEIISRIHNKQLCKIYYLKLESLKYLNDGAYLSYIKNKNSHPNLLFFGKKRSQ